MFVVVLVLVVVSGFVELVVVLVITVVLSVIGELVVVGLVVVGLVVVGVPIFKSTSYIQHIKRIFFPVFNFFLFFFLPRQGAFTSQFKFVGSKKEVPGHFYGDE